MNSSQLTFDFMTNASPQENRAVMSGKEQPSASEGIFDVGDLFSTTSGLEERHNNCSTAVLGDCLTVLRRMKSSSVNLIFADAPYNIGKDFGNNSDK